MADSLCKEQKMTERERVRGDLLLVGSFFLPITEKALKWLHGEKKRRGEEERNAFKAIGFPGV